MENPIVKCQYASNNGLNIVPRAVVVIGGTPTIPLSFYLLENISFESDILSFRLPMDLIDMSEIIKKSNMEGNVFVVELWTGYISSVKQHTWNQSYSERLYSNEELKQNLLKDYEKLLEKRWVGVLKQFEMSYNSVDEADFVDMVCGDFSMLLQESYFEAVFNDTASKLENVVDTMNKQLVHFEFTFDERVPQTTKDYLMGYEKKIKRDKANGDETEVEKEIRYSTEGKTYWDIIRDIVNKGRLKVIADREQSTKDKIVYRLIPRFTGDRAWILSREQHWNKLTLRNGKIGNGSPSKVGVEIRSAQSDGTTVVATFPENLSSGQFPLGSVFYIVNAAKGQTFEQLQLRAKEIAAQYARYDITGDMQLPNAIVGIKANDNLIITDQTPFLKGRRVSSLAGDISKPSNGESQDAINFTIKSITEDYDPTDGGYKQKIEFEMNMTLNTIDLQTGELKGRDLFPSHKNPVEDEFKRASFQKPELSDLPSNLRRIREQGGL